MQIRLIATEYFWIAAMWLYFKLVIVCHLYLSNKPQNV